MMERSRHPHSERETVVYKKKVEPEDLQSLRYRDTDQLHTAGAVASTSNLHPSGSEDYVLVSRPRHHRQRYDVVIHNTDNDLSMVAAPPPVQQPPLRDTVEGRTSGPSNITGYHDNRERAPLPEQQQNRMTVAPHQSLLSPMDPIQGPASFELPSSPNGWRNKPISLCHDRESVQESRRDYYEVRDKKREMRSHHHEKYDNNAEQGGFGV